VRVRELNKVLVLGGAGFIGSHLVDALLAVGTNVSVFDNLTTGTLQNIKKWLNNPGLSFVKGDLLNPAHLRKIARNHYDVIFHIAANPEVRVGSTNPNVHFRQSIVVTHNLLEHLRRTDSYHKLIFTSTSTVYGDAMRTPTTEDYGPLLPISTYGASKLACEALISAYAYTYGFNSIIYRLANVVGSRSQHGVIYDFIQKLTENPKELEILGDGTQNKSYLYVADCINAMLLGLKKANNRVEIYNVGSKDQINVNTIAQIVIREMKLKNVKLTLTGGVDGGRGWEGDVKNMLLDINKLKSLGWKPKLNSQQAIARATAENLTRTQLN
jgi:UDP-glucose 4-epimerase